MALRLKWEWDTGDGNVALDPIYVMKPFSARHILFFFPSIPLEFSVVYVNFESWFEPFLQDDHEIKVYIQGLCVVPVFGVF